MSTRKQPQQVHDHAHEERPLVSVIMPLFNAQQFIGEAIESVLAQTYSNWELLIVDDGSTDGSPDIARNFVARYPARIRYLQHEDGKNHGASATRNQGLQAARGEYLTFLDADDVYMPRKLEHQVTLLNALPGIGMVLGATEYWDGKAAQQPEMVWRHFGFEPGTTVAPPVLLRVHLQDRHTLPCMGGLMIRKNVVDHVGGFENQFRGLFDDQAFLAKVCLTTSVYATPECVDRYRQHSGSMCHRASHVELHRAKGFYFEWLRDHLLVAGIDDPEIHAALDRALWPYRHPYRHRAQQLYRSLRRRLNA